ncbi:hypothetical protein [Paenibacillus sp. MZ04-78.2]|nr:hypothetical protein [Paenibacillus sp. MZ04-78.2]
MKKMVLMVMLSLLIFGPIHNFPVYIDYSKGIIVQNAEGDPGM